MFIIILFAKKKWKESSSNNEDGGYTRIDLVMHIHFFLYMAFPLIITLFINHITCMPCKRPFILNFLHVKIPVTWNFSDEK